MHATIAQNIIKGRFTLGINESTLKKSAFPAIVEIKSTVLPIADIKFELLKVK